MTKRNLFILLIIGVGIAGAIAVSSILLSNDKPEMAADSNPVRYKAGAYQFGLELSPSTPIVGENTLVLTLQDSNGNPVENASLSAIAEMPAMGSMAAMQSPAEMTETAPGVYKGSFEPYMKGSWPLTLTVNHEEFGKARVNFDLATGREGMQLSSGARAIGGSKGKTQTTELPYRAGDIRFSAEVLPETPRVGPNTLAIVLRDQDGDPIDDASITAIAEMPAMGTMPAMRAPAEMASRGSGRYEGTFRPSMEGSWPLTLEIRLPGQAPRRVSFDLATGRKGIQLSSGATRADGGESMEMAPPGTVTLDPSRRQLIGVKTARTEYRDMSRPVRAVGTVAYDETRLADVSLKFDAWIGELYADYVGKPVKKGDPLFTVYSPDLYAAQQEFLELARRNSSRGLLEAARKRLLLWNMSETEIEALQRRGSPADYVLIRAPMTGVVVTKNIVVGTAHRAGMTLLRLADLSEVWVEAELYESELSLLSEGMAASIQLPHARIAPLDGEVSFIYPFADRTTRTTKVRVQVANPEGALKPAMYTEVTLQSRAGERLTIPEEAVIISGQKRYVFEDIGEGRLAPRKVETGLRANGFVEILSGLEENDSIVTSGNFLIASESRLKAGIDQW